MKFMGWSWAAYRAAPASLIDAIVTYANNPPDD